MRLALSSDNGFWGFLDLGLGLDMLFPSLKDQGSGWIEDLMGILSGFMDFGFGFGFVLKLGGGGRNGDSRMMIFISLLLLPSQFYFFPGKYGFPGKYVNRERLYFPSGGSRMAKMEL